jgi:hypothetical protein
MKKFLISLVILCLLGLAAYYFYPSHHNAAAKSALLAQINEYEQEINARKQKANCGEPKNAGEFECMYGAVSQALPIVGDRYKTFQAYWMWIAAERNCDRKTGICTQMGVMPSPKDMRESLDSYVQFCAKNAGKC